MFENLKNFIRHGKQAHDTQVRNVENFDLFASSSTLNTPAGEPDMEIKNLINSDNNNVKESKYSKCVADIVKQENEERKKLPSYPYLTDYALLGKMGEGAFSIVYKAKDLKTGDLVAVKIIRKYQMDQKQQALVLKEVTIMRQLNHPNIVKFINFHECEEYYYIVQELVSGGEIFTEIVKYTYFSEDLARHVVLQLANAIKYLHEEVGVVHRDIKPENLLFEPIDFIPSKEVKYRKSDDISTKKDEGEFIYNVGGGGIGIVKLADFGLSKQIWEHNTKTPVGTIGYTAPEIVRDERYSKQVDMWGIGCILYTLLCGFPPFYDEKIEALTEKVASGQFTFLKPWWDEISYGAKNCVSCLLTVDPNKRYTIVDFFNDPWILNYIHKCKKYELKKNSEIVDSSSNTSASSLTMAPPQIPQNLKGLSSSSATYTFSPTTRTKSNHPIQSIETYQPIQQKKKSHFKNSVDTKAMYSPAAVALRDAFDISNAVHRKQAEQELLKKFNSSFNDSKMVIDENEEENEDSIGENQRTYGYSTDPKAKAKASNKHGKDLFELNLTSSAILERRKKNQNKSNRQIPLVIKE